MLLVVMCSSWSLSSPVAAGNPAWSVKWQPQRLVNGSPLIFRVSSPVRLKSLSGKWLGHDVFFTLDARTRAWCGFAGVSLETKPGAFTLELIGTRLDGKTSSFEKRVTVGRARYPSVAVTVARKFTEPNAEQAKQIGQDKTVKEEAFRSVSTQREWSGDFRAPASARISDVFGTRRTFNGKVQSTHQGLDFAVPPGTAVSAANSGTVLLARPLYFEGNCVVLDHGQGLLTLYLHLSEFKVKEGEHVNGGEVIGLSGGTGRATGPHLHVAVRWEGVYLDPAALLKLPLS